MALSTDIMVRFLADTKQLKRGVDEVDGTKGKLKSWAKGTAAAVGGLFAAAKIGEFAKDAVNAASDLNESASKVGVVFGTSAKQVQDWSKTSAESMGISQQAALEAAGTYGNLAVSLGLPQKTAADMSTSLVGLAGDLASFNNVPVGDALDALRSGLTGETEPLKKFGVNLNEAALKAQAMSMGLSDGKKPLDAAAKAQAAYALIMKQTTTAQGDFARTSGGLANGQRIATAQFDDMKASLGTALLPIMQQLVALLNQYLIPAFKVLADFVQANSSWLLPLAAAIAVVVAVVKAWQIAQAALNLVMSANPILLVVVAIAALIAGVIWAYKNVDWFRAMVQGAMRAVVVAFQWLRDAAVAVFNWLKANWPLVLAIITGPFGVAVLMVVRYWDQIKGAAKSVWDWFVAVWHGLTAIITAPFTAAWDVISGIWDAIKSGAVAVKDAIVGAFNTLVDFLRGILGGISGAVSNIANAIKGPINAIIGAWNSLAFNVPSFTLPEFDTHIPGIGKIGGQTLGGWRIDFPDLPKLAAGGIVTGPTLALLGEAGREAVVPLGRGVGNRYNISVNVAPGTDPVQTGRAIVSFIQRYERANGPGWRSA